MGFELATVTGIVLIAMPVARAGNGARRSLGGE